MEIYLRIILCVILVLLIILILIGQFNISYNPFNSKVKAIEEAFHNYGRCMKNGFTREYCLINPETYDSCICGNGTLGKFDSTGKCVCLEKKATDDNSNEPVSLYPDVFDSNKFYM